MTRHLVLRSEHRPPHTLTFATFGAHVVIHQDGRVDVDDGFSTSMVMYLAQSGEVVPLPLALAAATPTGGTR
jgi:hypothetical protein